MSKADRRRRKLNAHRTAATGRDEAGAPTPERMRRGEVFAQTIVAPTPSADAARDWTGERAIAAPRRTAAAQVHRDLAASVRRRLERFKDLTPDQISAAERLERDWELARLEPRMIADLRATGGGRGWDGPADVSNAVLDARQRLHDARQALRRGGEEVLRVVEGVVIFEATADGLGAPIYTGRRDASIYVRTLLGIGLNLLARS